MCKYRPHLTRLVRLRPICSVPADGGGEPLVSVADNLLRVVYDKGPVDCHWETFSQARGPTGLASV